ncbi:monocarboxylate transporter 12 [Galendromus occidentalis]|uniref:Monocarboxylate transporter 12 n=1 Tax=Galendromus occidentalis TaxID=34638 RepID=A0AAJ7SH30_9ACAR|nr:monocarboxylate transporter 12 [Galendromus occidentalis]
MCFNSSSIVEVDSDLEGKKKALEHPKSSPVRNHSGPDGPESIRMAVVLGFMAFLASAGFRSAGFLYIGIMDTYGVTRQEASWPLSLIGALTNLSGVIAGPLAQRFSTRPVVIMGAICASLGMILSCSAATVPQLTLSLGVLYGFGNGVLFIVINSTLTQYFDKYRAVAFGIVYAGSTMASFVFPSLLLVLNSLYPFKSVLLIFGGIILNLFALSLYVKEPSWMREPGSKTSSHKKNSLKASFTIFREPIFYVCLLSNILFQYGFDAFMTTLVDFAVDRGATLQQAVNLLPWFSVADFMSRSVFPFAADKGYIQRPTLIMLCYFFTGIFTMCMPLSTNYVELVVFVLLMGSFCGCANVVFCCVFGDCLGVSRMPLAFGVLGTVNGGFYFTKPFFFGHFRDVVRSYDGMFWITGALSILVGLMWLMVIIKWRLAKNDAKQVLEESKTASIIVMRGCSNPSFSVEQTTDDAKPEKVVPDERLRRLARLVPSHSLTKYFRLDSSPPDKLNMSVSPMETVEEKCPDSPRESCAGRLYARTMMDSGKRLKPGPDGAESIRMAVVLGPMIFLAAAGFRSAGYLYVGIMETYGVSRQEASWPLSLVGVSGNLAGIIAGPLVQKFPAQPVVFFGAAFTSFGVVLSSTASTIPELSLFFGAFYGFGFGVLITSINVILTQYFDRYRAMAFGLVYSGGTTASFVFPHLLLALKSCYAFKGSLLLLGGILLNLFALTLLIKEPSWTKLSTSTVNIHSKATLTESFTIFREPIFYVFLVSNVLFQYGFDTFMTTLVDFAMDKGAALQEAVNLLPWFSAGDLVGRAILPLAADRGYIQRPKLITLCFSFTGIFTMCMPFARNYFELVGFVLLMGSFCGCANVVFACVFGDTLGVSRMPLAFGVLSAVEGCFFLTKPFFIGVFRDTVQSYDGMFYATGAMCFLCGVMWLIVLILKARSDKESGQAVTEESRVPSAASEQFSNSQNIGGE